MLSRWRGLLLACTVLTTGCASMTPPPGKGMNPSDTPPGVAAPGFAKGPGDERPRTLASSPPSWTEGEGPQRLYRRRGSRATVTQAGAGRSAGGAGSTVTRNASAPQRQRATETRQAVLSAVGEVKGTTGELASTLSKLATRPPTSLLNRGLSGLNGVFKRHLDYGSNQLPWIQGALGGITTLTEASSEVAHPDMQLALLRMSGPKLQAATSGTLLLAAWVDFLNLADVVLRECPAYSIEKLVVDMHRVQGMVEPSMTALASADPEKVEAVATALPDVMGELTREFQSLEEGARVAMERSGQIMAVAQLVEMLTMVSAMRLALPRLPPAAPATLGTGLVVGSNGVMVGSQVVVSAEWVETMRRLVQAGVLSAPAVSAAVRIHAGMTMAQASGELPQGVRDALGEGPEVRAMHETGRAGAGMGEAPKHHVLPREHREWFEQRGFTGDMDIDRFCVRMERASHEAIHGGGDWRLGRLWPGEWNRMIMKVLGEAEEEVGRMLTRNEVLEIVAREMGRYKIPMSFVSGRR